MNQFDYDLGQAWYCTMLKVGFAVFSLQPARSSAGDQLSTLVASSQARLVWQAHKLCHYILYVYIHR